MQRTWAFTEKTIHSEETLCSAAAPEGTQSAVAQEGESRVTPRSCFVTWKLPRMVNPELGAENRDKPGSTPKECRQGVHEQGAAPGSAEAESSLQTQDSRVGPVPSHGDVNSLRPRP